MKIVSEMATFELGIFQNNSKSYVFTNFMTSR